MASFHLTLRRPLQLLQVLYSTSLMMFPGHNSAIGYSFFYTCGAGSGDAMKGYVKDETGNWDETFTMQNVIDNNFQDGLSWNTFTASYNGKSLHYFRLQIHIFTQQPS